MEQEPGPVQESEEDLEEEIEALEDEAASESTVMPWLFPVIVIVAFFVLVVLLVLMIK